jgi:hypothetical protein
MSDLYPVGWILTNEQKVDWHRCIYDHLKSELDRFNDENCFGQKNAVWVMSKAWLNELRAAQEWVSSTAAQYMQMNADTTWQILGLPVKTSLWPEYDIPKLVKIGGALDAVFN